MTKGISQYGSSALLNKIYTEFYITEGWSGDMNNKHEVRQHPEAQQHRVHYSNAKMSLKAKSFSAD